MKQVSVQFPIVQAMFLRAQVRKMSRKLMNEFSYHIGSKACLASFCLEQTATPIKKFPDRVTFQTRKCITSLGFFAVEVGTALVSQVPPPHSWLRS